MNDKQQGIPNSAAFVGKFKDIFSSAGSQTAKSRSGISFIWAIAILLLVIFSALYISIRANNETIVRTNLMKNTAQVADNLELQLTNASSSIALLISKIEQEGNTPENLERFGQEYLSSIPEALLIRLIQPTGKDVQTVINSKLIKGSYRQLDEANYPHEVRDAFRDAFKQNRVTISSYFHDNNEPTSYVVIVYPFKLRQIEYGFLVKISLDRLLQRSIPGILKTKFDFSLMHGSERIAGSADFNSADDFTIPSYVRAAEPLPPTIQLYGSSVVETPIILASPLLLMFGVLMVFFVLLLFLLSRKIKKNQKALADARDEINLRRSVERSLKTGLIITDLNSKILFSNDRVSQITGYLEEELLGKESPYPFWDENTSLPAEILGTTKSGERDYPYPFDCSIYCKDGTTLKGLILASPFYSQDKVQIGWIYFLRDNSLSNVAQTLINDEISSYKKILNSVLSSISVVTHKPSGNILGITNNVYKKELGTTIEGHELISKAIKHPFDAEGQRKEEVWVEELGRWFYVTEARVTLPGGSNVTLQIALDITDNKRTEKKVAEQTTQLENSSRLVTIGEMASTITHEINQPLTAILVYSESAAQFAEKSPDRTVEVLKKINAQANRIDKIIKNIRSFAKRRTTLLEVTPMANVMSDVRELGNLIEKKYPGVTVDCEVSRDLPNVLCDPIQIVQVLMNLVSNAADAVTESNSPNKNITIRTEQVGEKIKVAVADHGPGMSETVKASLFTPFFSTKKTGLGLGLSTCKTIAEAHNTKLEVRDNDGGGTVFSFELKLAG